MSYEAIKAEIDEVGKQILELEKHRSFLWGKRYMSAAEKLKETGLLKRFVWKTSSTSAKCLICTRRMKKTTDDLAFEELATLLSADHHSRHDLMWINEEEYVAGMTPVKKQFYDRRQQIPGKHPVCSISFCDGDLSIHADTPEYLLQFIRAFGIKVDLSDVRAKRDGLKMDLENAEKMLATLEEKYK